MKIQRIKLIDCYGHREAEVDLESLDAATIIGMNGAGKSTLFVDGPLFALFGKPAIRSETLAEVVREGAETAEAIVEFDVDRRRYRVRRTYSIRTKAGASSCELLRLEDGEFVPVEAGSITEVDAAIEEVIGRDYSSFVLGSIVKQGESRAFTDATPTERIDSLSQILGVNHLNRCATEARAERRESEVRIGSTQREIEKLSERLSEESLEEIKLEHQKRSEEVEAYDRRIGLVEETRSRAGEWIEAARSRRDSLSDRVDIARELQSKRDNLDEELSSLREKRSTASAEIKVIQNQLSMKLEQLEEIPSEPPSKTVDQLDEIGKQLRERFDLFERLEAEVGHKLEEIPKLEAQFEKATEEIDQLDEQIPEAYRSEESIDDGLETLEAQLEEAVEGSIRIADLRERAIALERQAMELRSERESATRALESRAKALEGRPAECEMDHCGLLQDAWKAKRRLEEMKDEEPREAGTLREAEKLRSEIRDIEESVDLPLDGSGEVARLTAEREAERLERFREALRRLDDLKVDRTAIKSQLETIRAQLEDEQGKLYHLREDHSLEELRERLEELRNERARLSSEWSTWKASTEKRSSLEEEVESLRDKLEKSKASAEEIMRSLGDRDFERLALDEKLENFSGVWSEYLDNGEALDAFSEERAKLDRELSELREYRSQAVRDVERAEAALESLRSTEEQLEEARRILEEHRRERDRLGYAAEFFKLAPSIVLGASIPKIEDDANAILEQIAPKFRISVDRQRHTRAGDARDEVSISVYVAGVSRSISLLSGGERFRVDIALRMALAEASTGSRSGRPIETMIIDEGWGSLDPEGVHDLKEAMQRLRSRFSKIFVITHVPDVRDLFPATVEVAESISIT